MGIKSVFLLALLTSSPMAESTCRNANSHRNSAQLKATDKNLSSWTPCSGVSPWEVGDLLEGDIMIGGATTLRQTLLDRRMKWPNKELPYRIESKHFSEKETQKILDAITAFNSTSCVRLRPATKKDEDYVNITGSPGGCYSGIGRMGGVQVLNLQPPTCLERGTITHEIFHAFGFVHEHNSPQRDKYVRIQWKNIEKDKKIYFHKRTKIEVTDFGLGYDYRSIMHGSRTAHSKNGKATILAMNPNAQIGQRVRPSGKDILKLKKMYDCD